MKLYLILVMVFLIHSCDFPSQIKYKNQTQKKLEVLIHFADPDEFKENTKAFKIDPLSKATVLAGMGTKWTDEYLQNYINNIDSIYFASQDETFTLDSSDVSNLFGAGKKGLLGKNLTIVIDENLLKRLEYYP